MPSRLMKAVYYGILIASASLNVVQFGELGQCDRDVTELRKQRDEYLYALLKCSEGAYLHIDFGLPVTIPERREVQCKVMLDTFNKFELSLRSQRGLHLSQATR